MRARGTAGSPAAVRRRTGRSAGTLKDGSTFTLKQSIQDKLALNSDDDPANDVPIQYVFSYGSDSIPLFSPQYRAGFERSIPEAQAIMPQLSGTPIAPASALQDVNLQIQQIQALWEAGLIDCLSIQSTGTDAFTNITNQIMAEGIPVFTVGVQSNGNELTNFTQISLNEGAQAAADRARLDGGDRQRPERLRRVRRRPAPELGPGPHAGLHRRHQGGQARRDVRQRRDAPR